MKTVASRGRLDGGLRSVAETRVLEIDLLVYVKRTRTLEIREVRETGALG